MLRGSPGLQGPASQLRVCVLRLVMRFKVKRQDSSGGLVAKTAHSWCRRPGSVPGQGTGPSRPQLKILCAASKSQCSQGNGKHFKRLSCKGSIFWATETRAHVFRMQCVQGHGEETLGFRVTCLSPCTAHTHEWNLRLVLVLLCSPWGIVTAPPAG